MDYEILDNIYEVLRRVGSYDDAITAKREAIAAGYRSVPHPEADIAECLLAAGRSDEALALFAELRERDPDDVWLFNSRTSVHAAPGAGSSKPNSLTRSPGWTQSSASPNLRRGCRDR